MPRRVLAPRARLWLHAAVAVAAYSGASAGAVAHEVKHGDLAIAHPFVTVDNACDQRVTRAHLMLIVNTGTQPDRLIAASLDGGGKGLFIRSSDESGQATRAVISGGIDVAPGTPVRLMPPDYVIEFPKTRQTLVEGGMVTGSLTFQRAGRFPVQFMVEAAHPAADGKHDCKIGAATSHSH